MKVMIRRGQIVDASFEVRRKAKQTRAYERGNFVLIVPHDPQKQFRLVGFLPNDFVLCVAYETGEECEANSHQRVCYHCYAANRRREINAKRRQTLKRRQSRAA